ncbi:hypothetical protein RQP46_005419 [Phenoliferia psychrophenolica]
MIPAWLALVACVVKLTVALSVAEVANVFGSGATDLTGHALFSLNATKTAVGSVGLALLVLVLVQLALGALAHWTKASPRKNARVPTLSGKHPYRLGHIFLGIAIFALGLFEVHEGVDEYSRRSDGAESVPLGVFIVYYILIGLIAACYVSGWMMEGLGWNRPKSAGSLRRESIPMTETR